LNRATLARQMLLAREAIDPLAAIERLAGLQAQLARPPHLGLWSRIADFEPGALLELLRARRAVRATMMRGTLHIVSARDYVALRSVLQPMLTAGVTAVLRGRAKGIDFPAVVTQARQLFAGGPRTFEEIRDALAAAHPEADHRAMGFIARLMIPLVQVPTLDDAWGFPGTPRFALADAWLGEKIATADSPAQLVLRYLAAFGPAAAADVQTWSGIKSLKEAFEQLRPKLLVLADERGRELFDLPKAPRPPGDTVAPVRFLPEFDNLVMAHADRRRFLADAYRRKVYLPGLRLAPTVLVDGFVAAVWGVRRTKAAATISIEPFEALSARTRGAVAAEAERVARFAEPEAKAFDVKIAKA
jgi:hypothetical protein